MPGTSCVYSLIDIWWIAFKKCVELLIEFHGKAAMENECDVAWKIIFLLICIFYFHNGP